MQKMSIRVKINSKTQTFETFNLAQLDTNKALRFRMKRNLKYNSMQPNAIRGTIRRILPIRDAIFNVGIWHPIALARNRAR